jgi:tetratricopeptide (TPR) repeat protein
MSNERSRLLIAEANKAIQEGNYSNALNMLDEAGELDPNDPEIYELRGIAHAQLGLAEAAVESLRKATMLAPTAKNFYNLAVHLYDIGDKADAHDAVREALRLDPKHLSAKKLLRKIAGTGGDPQFVSGGKSLDTTVAATKKLYGFGKKHLFTVFGDHQREWTNLGWTIVGLSVLSTIVIKFNFPFAAPPKPDMKSVFMGYKPIDSLSAFATIGFFTTMILASMIWTSIDLIDRRGRALWMVPMMICCFLFMPFLPQALYMFAGRKD